MLPVIVHVFRVDGRTDKLPCWALCDSGSNVDCVRADIVESLGIETFKVMTKLTTLSKPSSEMKGYCHFYVSNMDESGGFDITAAMIVNNFQGHGERPPRDSDITGFKHLVDAGKADAVELAGRKADVKRLEDEAEENSAKFEMTAKNLEVRRVERV